MTSPKTHSAAPSALGYYYQAVYALRLLLSGHDDASVSIESWDDVYFEAGARRELHQLKHSLDATKQIGIKSRGVWRTLTIWLDFAAVHDISQTSFILATVASFPAGSALECLTDDSADRSSLRDALLAEAERVRDDRLKAQQLGKPEAKWPHADRAADCERYLLATPGDREALLKRVKMCPGSFNIADAKPELAKLLANTVPKGVIPELTTQLLAWWDRQVVETLTGERKEPLLGEEVRGEVTTRAAALHEKGFFEDTETYLATLPPIAAAVTYQLDFIDASTSQRKRVTPLEAAARAQRAAWMKADVAKTEAIRQYDRLLIREWSYHFDETAEECKKWDDDKKKSSGRDLLNWSHFDAHLQVRSIDKKYDNPDFIRGSYLYLSGQGSVGWHPEYEDLLKELEQKTRGKKK